MSSMNNSSNIILLRGQVEELIIGKIDKNYLRSEADDNASMLVAIALAMTGNDGMAMGTLNAIGSGSQQVDLVEFRIGGQHVKGVLWKFPFSENDEVEVVAQRQSKYPWKCLSVRRVNDGLIAVHPQCKRGRQAYILTCIKIILVVGILLAGAMSIMLEQTQEALATKYLLIGFAFCLGSFFSGFFSIIAYFKDLKFIRLAELIFCAFGWDKPSRINLPKESKKRRKSEDKFPYGWTFFRYVP